MNNFSIAISIYKKLCELSNLVLITIHELIQAVIVILVFPNTESDMQRNSCWKAYVSKVTKFKREAQPTDKYQRARKILKGH